MPVFFIYNSILLLNKRLDKVFSAKFALGRPRIRSWPHYSVSIWFPPFQFHPYLLIRSQISAHTNSKFLALRRVFSSPLSTRPSCERYRCLWRRLLYTSSISEGMSSSIVSTVMMSGMIVFLYFYRFLFCFLFAIRNLDNQDQQIMSVNSRRTTLKTSFSPHCLIDDCILWIASSLCW